MGTDNGKRKGARTNLSKAALDAVRCNIVLPVYFAVDISCSVEFDVLDRIGAQVASLISTLAAQARVQSNIHAAVIEFDERPRVLLPLRTVATIGFLPGLSRGYHTGYGGLFAFLREEIERDVGTFSRNGSSVGQPLVVIVTDGRFEKSWRDEFYRLIEYDAGKEQGFAWRPAVLPLALLGGDTRNIRKLCVPTPLCLPHLVQDDAANDEILVSVVEYLLERVLATPNPVVAHYEADDFI
jgi:uncharacterized protein YegL